MDKWVIANVDVIDIFVVWLQVVIASSQGCVEIVRNGEQTTDVDPSRWDGEH